MIYVLVCIEFALSHIGSKGSRLAGLCTNNPIVKFFSFPSRKPLASKSKGQVCAFVRVSASLEFLGFEIFFGMDYCSQDISFDKFSCSGAREFASFLWTSPSPYLRA